MKTKINKIAFAIGALAMSSGAMAATATGDAHARVITPISIAQDSGSVLEFGAFSTSAALQTVTIAADGTASGSAALSTGGGLTRAAGAFTVTGEPSFTFALTMPTSSAVTISGNATAAGTMALTGFTVAPASGYAALAGTAPNYTSTLMTVTGLHKFTVGGTLTTVASQASGSYTGNYVVTVAYN